MRPILLLALLLSSNTTFAAAPERPAPAPVRPVVENYFGTLVTDDYRYMEDPKDPVFLPWIKSEGRYTRALLDSIPGRAELGRRVSSFSSGFGVVRNYASFNSREFWLERSVGSDNFDLFVRDADGTRKLIDVEKLRAARGGKPVAINYYSASPDGASVAIGVSESGSERTSLWVYEVATGRQVAGPLERIQLGPASWSSDSTLLFANQLAKLRPGASPTARYLNSTAVAWDMKNPPTAIYGAGVPGSVIATEPTQFPMIKTRPGTSFLAAVIQNGVQNELEIWLAPDGAAPSAKTAWQRVVTREDGVTHFDVLGETLYLLSHKGAPTYQVWASKLGQPFSAARPVIPARSDVLIESIRAAADGIYVIARQGLHSRLSRLSVDGSLEQIPVPNNGSIDAWNVFGDARRLGVTIAVDSWIHPQAVLTYDPATKRFIDKNLGSRPATYNPDAFVASTTSAIAKDGTRVPMSLVRPAGARGPQPLLMLAYGSYGASNFPYFSPHIAAVLNEGIGFSVCHVRGGGELGDSWRLAGKGANKPNSWRDLIACAEEAVKQGITTSKQLFINGESAGGIPILMAMTERPDLFAGVIAQVPMASALRAEYQTNGPVNVVEFGTVKDEQGFHNLLAMDGYQHIRDGAKYPPILLTTGLNDARVDSWQPGKLAARLIAANKENVVLLRVDEQAGHGAGSTSLQVDAIYADMIAFMKWQLGGPGSAPVE